LIADMPFDTYLHCSPDLSRPVSALLPRWPEGGRARLAAAFAGMSSMAMSMMARLAQAFLVGLCAIHAGMAVSAAQTAPSAVATEHEVKAAFLYKFLGYVEWPPTVAGDPGSPITIGVIGAADVAADLARIASGRGVDNRPVMVRTVAEEDSLAGIQVLFLGGTDRARLNRMLKAAQQRSILTVTEADGALGQGSVINFRTVDGRVRFEVSLEAADKSNIKLSSRLLAVALNVQRTTP
jgi:YfiR/HmsC-like